MLPRILSYIIFWSLMTLIILGSILVVSCLYLPFVVIKALCLGLSGKIGKATNASDPSAHRGAPDPAARPADQHPSR